jgi:SWI/SNF related-matrix-associated actin-dependent regulator of chromatin subfamily C
MVTADTPRGLQPAQPAPGSTATSGKLLAATERLASTHAASKADLTLELRRNIYDDKGKAVTPSESKDKPANGEGANGEAIKDGQALTESLKEATKQYNCFNCGIDCSRVRYHVAKSPPPGTQGKNGALSKHDLCATCFLEGHFPASLSASDYTKLENETYSALPDRDAPWTDSETLLLLEGLELFDDDWNSVSDHVGTRTREECILKFLQLEIEDPYLEPDQSLNNTDASIAPLNYLSNGRIPFTQADNPVLSVMGFLAGLADPSVTAAAAGKSVEEMRRTLKEKLEKGTSISSNKGKEKDSIPTDSTGEVKHEDSMEVDEETTVSTAVGQVAVQSSPKSLPLASAPFALAAARSTALASHEERNITTLVSGAVNTQLAKINLKLQQFQELESLLSAERRDLERRRQQLFLDRLAFQKRVAGLEDACRKAQIASGTGTPDEVIRMLADAVRGFGIGGRNEQIGVNRRESAADGEVKPLGPNDTGYRHFEI